MYKYDLVFHLVDGSQVKTSVKKDGSKITTEQVLDELVDMRFCRVISNGHIVVINMNHVITVSVTVTAIGAEG